MINNGANTGLRTRIIFQLVTEDYYVSLHYIYRELRGLILSNYKLISLQTEPVNYSIVFTELMF